MCTKPIRIKNNAKYINTEHGQPYYLWVNCGHCEECLRSRQMEWNLRTYYTALETIKKGGYLYFDTLTYDNKNLPRISRHLETKGYNWACFDYRDIRGFYETLRHHIYKNVEKEIRYFITCEYGSIRNRPHMHLILFVTAKIDPVELSKNVSIAWTKGRTDGQPYKSKKYVLDHNVIRTINLDCIRYVAKYVNKSTHFTQIINKRWNKLENLYKNHMGLNTLEIKRRKRKYYNLCTPFHRQSQHFGENALEYFSIDYLINGGKMFYKDDSMRIIQNIGLPMYFRRKLFQKQIKYNGKRIWVNTELGIQYKQLQHNRVLERIEDRLKDLNQQNGCKYDNLILEEIARYILDTRGRFNGDDDYKPHHEEAEFYNYHTDRDMKYLGKKCISTNFAGNDIIGYCTTEIEPIEIEDGVRMNNEYETIINELMKEKDTTKLSLLKEHLAEIRKVYFNPRFSV